MLVDSRGYKSTLTFNGIGSDTIKSQVTEERLRSPIITVSVCLKDTSNRLYLGKLELKRSWIREEYYMLDFSGNGRKYGYKEDCELMQMEKKSR